jgi:predicted nucleic acid-binding protein
MKLVFDTNVIVDVLAVREPFVGASKKAMAVAARADVAGAMTANTLTDIFYLLTRHGMPQKSLKAALINLMDYLEVLDTTSDLCLLACHSDMADFEDALLAESAKLWSADLIVTRNAVDFAKSPIKAITPTELLDRPDV